MDQNSQNIFWSITHEPLAYLNFNATFEFLEQFTIIDAYFIFQKVLIILR